jgi:hypothetical protein
MAKQVTERWLATRLHPEHRITVYYGARELRGITALLRSFRDGKVNIGSVEPIHDLGIREGMDHFDIWSSDRTGLIQLKEWFEGHGCETTGIW